MKKVSILVPVFGVEQYIERCSRSLFEQSYQDLEFVFVNDCSPDCSINLLLEVIKDYPERKDAIRIINHEKNRGLAASRNTGLDHSTGDFVVCVDSDDWLALDAIESLVTKQLEKDADMVSGHRLIHYENNEELLPEREYKDKEQMTLQMMQHTWDHFVTGRLFRRSLFIDNGLRWQEGYDVAEDRFIMSLLAYYTNIFDKVDSIVYHYERGNVNALTKSNDGRKVLRNNKQEYGNMLSLEQFFKDKEPVYKKECTRCVMEQLEFYLRATVAFSFREEYYQVLDFIEKRNDAEQKLIGWEKRGLMGWMKHRFGCMVFSRYMNKAIRFFKRKVQSVIRQK